MEAEFVGVDWGTSNGRFMLVDAAGQLIAERAAPGIASFDSAAAIEAACFDTLADWPKRPVVMTGTVGANIGWRLAPYRRAPVAPGTDSAVRFEIRGQSFVILAGIDTIRDDGCPDVMRGENTQIAGAIGSGSAIVCLPGTHCKWVVVERGMVMQFHTTMTGELLDIVGRNSILLHPKRALDARVNADFLDGVAAMTRSSFGLETMLFTVRTRQLAGTLRAETADSYLAGLCIGADVRSGLAVHPGPPSVTLIGTPRLTTLYAAALATFGATSHQIDGRDAALAGLTQAYRAMFT